MCYKKTSTYPFLVLLLVGILCSESSEASTEVSSSQVKQSASVEQKMKALKKELGFSAKRTGHQKSNTKAARSSKSAKGTKAIQKPSRSLLLIGSQTILALGFVLVLAVVCMRLLKKAQSSSFMRGTNNNKQLLSILETCHVGKEQKVVVMEFGKERKVLGVTAHNISVLSTLQDTSSNTFKKEEVAFSPVQEFKGNLEHYLGKFKKAKTVEQTLSET